MSNPFSGSDIPGMNSMGDPLGFIKKLWGSMNVPGMVAPPMSVDELDKKIQDLKTVESWLNVNMNMLRGTIQALEVQRATIATLQSLGENFAQHMQQASAQANAQASAAQTDIPKPGSSNASDHTSWPMPPASAPVQESAPEPEPESIPSQTAETAEKTPGSASGNEAGTPFANPAAWWNLLQNQFKQAVSQAMEGDGLAKETLSKADATKPKTNARPGKSETASAKTAAKPTAKASASAVTKSKNKTGVSSKTASKSTPKTVAKTTAKIAAKATTKTPQK